MLMAILHRGNEKPIPQSSVVDEQRSMDFDLVRSKTMFSFGMLIGDRVSVGNEYFNTASASHDNPRIALLSV